MEEEAKFLVIHYVKRINKFKDQATGYQITDNNYFVFKISTKGEKTQEDLFKRIEVDFDATEGQKVYLLVSIVTKTTKSERYIEKYHKFFDIFLKEEDAEKARYKAEKVEKGEVLNKVEILPFVIID